MRLPPFPIVRRAWPTRVKVTFDKKDGDIALDQIRAVVKRRLVRKLGAAKAETAKKVGGVLMEMFS